MNSKDCWNCRCKITETSTADDVKNQAKTAPEENRRFSHSVHYPGLASAPQQECLQLSIHCNCGTSAPRENLMCPSRPTFSFSFSFAFFVSPFFFVFFFLFFLFSLFFIFFFFFLFSQFFSRQSRRQNLKKIVEQLVLTVSMTISFCENSIFGSRWTGWGVKNGPFEVTSLSYFSFLFHVFHFFMEKCSFFLFFFSCLSFKKGSY